MKQKAGMKVDKLLTNGRYMVLETGDLKDVNGNVVILGASNSAVLGGLCAGFRVPGDRKSAQHQSTNTRSANHQPSYAQQLSRCHTA